MIDTYEAGQDGKISRTQHGVTEMGIILSNDYLQIADTNIYARSVASGFSKANVMDYWHLKRRLRAGDLTKSDINPIYRFDMTSAQTIVGIVLIDVNFNKVRIRGHATDLGVNWAASTFDSGADHIVSLNTQINRYHIYIPLTAFNLRWSAIMTPAAASAVGSYTTYWEIGSVVLLDSVTTLTKNMAYGYARQASKAYQDITLAHGGGERISLGDQRKWEADVIFGNRILTDEAELWTIDNYDIGKPLIFYENDGDTSKVYLCLRDSGYEGTIEADNIVKGNMIRFKELI